MLLFLLGMIPSFLIFIPLVILISTCKQFNRHTGAISDLNNFRRSKVPYIIIFALWNVSQILYIFAITASKGVTIYPSQMLLLVASFFILLIGLPFNSHTLKHLIPVTLSCSLLFINMFLISLLVFPVSSIFRPVYLLILAVFIMAGIMMGISLFPKVRKIIPFYLLEFFVLGLFGIWNILFFLS